MNTIFTRLLWKEYRAQRMLWVVLLVGWLAIHLLLCVFNGTSVLDIMPVIPMIPVCFIVAASLIAFAGEEDEKTANFLRMLPFQTRTLMSSKLTAVAVGCLTLVMSMLVLSVFLELILSGVLFIAAAIVDQPSAFRFPVVKPTPNSIPWRDGDVFYVPAFLALVFATSVFSSMVTRRVFSAVGLTVAMIMAIVITALAMTSYVHQGQLRAIAPWLAEIAVIFMTLSTVVLSRPWHLGRLPRRWTMPETAENSVTRRISSFAWLWQRWLRRIVAMPLTMPRILTMLTWRECRSAVPFALTWLTIGVLICSGRYFSSVFYPWPFLFLIVFIHECGQRTMRDDQQTKAISMLANLGVHPLQIWFSKTFVWLCVACAVGSAVVVTDASTPDDAVATTLGIPSQIDDIVASIRVPEFGFPFGDRSKPLTSLDRDRQISVRLSAVIGLFSLGQLTACWIQRQIIAFAASLLVFFLAMPGLFHVLARDWPVWVTLFPIAVCGLLAPALTAHYWIERRVTWSLRIKQFAMVIVPCTLFPLLGQSAWRVQPIMAFNRESGLSAWSVYNLQNPGNSPEIAQLIAMTQSRSEDWIELDKPEETRCWYEFAAAVERFPLHQTAIPSSHSIQDRMPGNLLLSQAVYQESDPKKIHEVLQPFDEVLAKNDAFPLLPISWTGPWSKTPAVALSILLLEDARHREASGDIAGAIQQIVRTIRANRSLAIQTSSWANWLACLDAERVALGRLRILLGTADLSAIDLDSLQSELTSALVMSHHNGNAVIQLPDPTMMLQRRSLFWSDACFGGTLLERVQKLPVVQQGFEVKKREVNLRHALHFLEGADATRAFFTMKYSESLLVEKYDNMTIQGRVRFLQEPRTGGTQQLNRLMSTSSIADLNVDLEILSANGIESYFIVPQIDTIASERATLLTIMLQKYRIAHGKFPESLIDLKLDAIWDNLILPDPWTGTPFFYVASDHTPPLRLGWNTEAPPVTAGQPLLFTPGGSGASLKTYLPQTAENGSVEMYKLPANVVLFLGLNDDADWRYSQVATTVTVASEVNPEPSVPAR
ncbi:MAG: hypothetical protein WKF77_17375 [Planctomycetaceae bacterium]